MSLRDDSLRLADMLTAARDATGFIAGRIEGDLAKDRQLTLALLKCVKPPLVSRRKRAAIISIFPGPRSSVCGIA